MSILFFSTPCVPIHAGIDLKAALAFKTCKCDTSEASAELERQFGPFKRKPPWIRYGGPGQIASVGLMKMLNHDTFKACGVRRNPGCGGGEALCSQDRSHTAYLSYRDGGSQLSGGSFPMSLQAGTAPSATA